MDELIARLAVEARLDEVLDPSAPASESLPYLNRFAALIAEECAKLADLNSGMALNADECFGLELMQDRIRARFVPGYVAEYDLPPFDPAQQITCRKSSGRLEVSAWLEADGDAEATRLPQRAPRPRYSARQSS